MAATISLMTVQDFRELPEDNGPVYHELRHGEIVSVSRPKASHYRIQRVADVAYVSQQRWDDVDPDDNLPGSPELVIEVLSPSNTATEIYDERLCLENGAQECWVIDSHLGPKQAERNLLAGPVGDRMPSGSTIFG